MKKFILTLCMLAMTACKSGGSSGNSSGEKIAPDDGFLTSEDLDRCGSSNIVGVWSNLSDPMSPDLEFEKDCAGKSNYCGSNFRWKLNETETTLTLIFDTPSILVNCPGIETSFKCSSSGASGGAGGTPIYLSVSCEELGDNSYTAREWGGIPEGEW